MGHYTGQNALAGTPSQELEDILEQSFVVHMTLLANSTFILGRRCWSSQQLSTAFTCTISVLSNTRLNTEEHQPCLI